ncbi:lysylphosphatidylglycerol synthase transmembrane domain-containing protein [Prosthecomicrobium pneumaticum]|uniref:Uncharacterized protein n=1 Tax=Prosthecomicrobium pneumaticum TaxID=81895 RepID=A0A7W9CVZ1_9HYPH|nr:YbhN family protein [Prosthecomicrobium pneumaticum]MBB5752357.1 hypothetical protein [Prosthecomicrobium pneumaticum]
MSAAADASPSGRAGKRLLRWGIGLAAVALGGFLLYRTLAGYSLDDLVASVTGLPGPRLAGAAGFAAASYLALTVFDFLALGYAGRPLPYRQAALASFCSLSLGHNIGFAGLSSGAIRYRFYARWGLDTEAVAKVVLFCGVTVGLGLSMLAGIGLALDPTLATDLAGLSTGVVYAIAALCCLVPLAYIGLAARLRQPLRIRSWSFAMPSARRAAAQVAVGTVNFALVAACLHQVLQAVAEPSYADTVSAYVTANVATLVTHVPGGAGVIETVIQHMLPGARLIGALIAFRAIYFLAPLAIGSLVFAVAELVFRGRSAQR